MVKHINDLDLDTRVEQVIGELTTDQARAEVKNCTPRLANVACPREGGGWERDFLSEASSRLRPGGVKKWQWLPIIL